jgi:hypothetical protein
MEKFLNVFITLVLVSIAAVVAKFGFDFLTQARPLEQTVLIVNLLILVSVLLGSSLYFTVTKFRSASA